jgi:hypothetical protein
MPSPTESLPAPDWSPIQLHFHHYLRTFWLNAPFHGAIIRTCPTSGCRRCWSTSIAGSTSPATSGRLSSWTWGLTARRPPNCSTRRVAPASPACSDYSIPGESRPLRPRLNRASPSPARQRIIIAQVGSSGTGCALLTLEAEPDVGAVLSESGGGGKSPKS